MLKGECGGRSQVDKRRPFHWDCESGEMTGLKPNRNIGISLHVSFGRIGTSRTRAPFLPPVSLFHRPNLISLPVPTTTQRPNDSPSFLAPNSFWVSFLLSNTAIELITPLMGPTFGLVESRWSPVPLG